MADPAIHLPPRRQRVVRTRRQYNQWVADQTREDYALRFTAEQGRRWPTWRVANTALGSIAFLACEAIGATVALNFGFTNLAWALAITAVIVIVTGAPICYYAARYGVDMDLLTRGAGFGYLGSTITSAIYASFTFILFAIEAAILSAALKLCFGIPLALGHIISALIVIPIAAYGVRRISWLQTWSQPIWLILQLAPLIYIGLQARAGITVMPELSGHNGFNLVLAGGALAVILSLLPQIGEQVDYLRFMPIRTRENRVGWWSALLLTGPGWILMGGAKILLGGVLAFLAVRGGMSAVDAAAPAQMYNVVFAGLLGSPTAALIVTCLFVAVCQLKINVTNAYAGSIAASNFFSRLTHRHPGRVVWLVFNVIVALQLMQVGILEVVERILALYSNFAVAWIGAVTADLLINKPLGLSPKGIEFKRAYLYDINPVGVGAMAISIVVSTICFTGAAGEIAQAFASLIGIVTAFIAAPAIAVGTGGRYYLARTPQPPADITTCVVCENAFEPQDMAPCPVYQGPICSLCCTLEARCHDACKDSGRLLDQTASFLRRILPAKLPQAAYAVVARFLGVLALSAIAIGGLLGLIYYRQVNIPGADAVALRSTLALAYAALILLSGFAAWFFVLAGESQRSAEEETDRQTDMLMDEIEAHSRTDAELQRAKEAAEAANLAKSRYIVGLSHEIRAPLNTISGYAQLIERNPDASPADAVRIIRRSTTHMADLVNGLLDISRIENGTLRVERNRTNLHDMLDEIVDMFRLQAQAKGIAFQHRRPANLPVWVYTDEKRLRQILINLLSNAIKYTAQGSAILNVRWRLPMAEFEVIDTGRGIPSADLDRIFEPFERSQASVSSPPGIGLGLTITKLLATVLGGEIAVRSTPGEGSAFKLRLMLSDAPGPSEIYGRTKRLSGYEGPRRRILATDDDPAHLDLLRELLAPLGFELSFAGDGASALETAAVIEPELIIMDISMPGIDGWETARRLRDLVGPDVAILMVSANAHDFSRSRREDDPHDDFLIKPYEIDDLFDRIQTLLGITWTVDQPQTEAAP